MAFDVAVPKYSGHQADQQGDNRDSSRGTTLVFSVLSSDPANDTALGAKLAVGVPRWRDPHPSDPYMRVRDVNAQRMSPILFEITVTYESPTGKEDQNPLDEPAKYRYSHIGTEEDIDTDDDGQLISTPNGESFDPPLREMFYDTLITVTKNIAVFDPSFSALYINKTNSSTFRGLPVDSVLITGFDGEEVIDDDFSYFIQTITFQYRKSRNTSIVPQAKVWWRRTRLEGMYALIGGMIVRAQVGGVDSIKPVLLKADGTQVTEDGLGDPANAEWQFSKTKGQQNFNAIDGLE